MRICILNKKRVTGKHLYETLRSIVLIAIEKYSIPFFNPVLQAKEKREGFYVSVQYQGEVFFSECSPYPFHAQKEEEIKSQLRLGVNTLFESLVQDPVNLCELLVTINQALTNQVEMSVIFAVETLAIQMPQFLIPRSTEFNFINKGNITLNALLSRGYPDEIFLEAKKLMRLGYRSFKLKIRPDDSFLSSIQSLIDVVDDDASASIRLDANGSFNFDDLVQALSGISTRCIEYIEEPTKDPTEFNKFFMETGIHYALDESLPHKQTLFQNYAAQKGLKACILKPMRIGLLNTLLYVKSMRSLEIQTVFSSTFETNMALLGIFPFTADCDTPMGFDITRRFPRKIPLHKYFKNQKNRLYWKIPNKITRKDLEPYLIA